jgi:hypothetical protein
MTFSLQLHYTIGSFFSTVLSQSSASIGSIECKKVGGLVLWNSPSLSLCCGCGACGVCYIVAMVCCMVWTIWACITKTCSKVSGGGGGRLASLLFSVLALWFFVLAI